MKEGLGWKRASYALPYLLVRGIKKSYETVPSNSQRILEIKNENNLIFILIGFHWIKRKKRSHNIHCQLC